MHEWMGDNGSTPHIVVDACVDGVVVPPEHVRDGKIILNVSYAATRGLTLDNSAVRFEARFEGVNHQIEVPTAAVMGIYARETGQGMIFSHDAENSEPAARPTETAEITRSRPHLKIVK